MKKYLILIILIFMFLVLIFNKEKIISQETQKGYTGRYKLFQGETTHYISDDKVLSNMTIFKIDAETGIVWRFSVKKKDGKVYEKWIMIP